MNNPTILNPEMELDIKGQIHWGANVRFGNNCRKCTIGFGCFISNDIYIDVEELSIGDYVTIHHGTVMHGKKCVIGHNCWIGHYCILDSLGGLLKIGNNVGVGAHSQLWSHMRFGDRLAGCRWYRNGVLEVGDDAWFVGHCIVSPIKVERRSMLLVGGVAVKDMKENHVYAGSPAVDITDKIGGQFSAPPLSEKMDLFTQYMEEHKASGNDTGFVKVVSEFSEQYPDKTCFNIETREYGPRYTEEEYRFMRFLLYDRAKFTPYCDSGMKKV